MKSGIQYVRGSIRGRLRLLGGRASSQYFGSFGSAEELEELVQEFEQDPASGSPASQTPAST